MKHYTKPALLLAVVCAASVVGAGFLAHDRRGPSFLERSLFATLGAPTTAADSVYNAPITPTVPSEPFYSEPFDSLVPPSSPADELASLPAIPANRPRDENYIIISRQWNRLWLMRNEKVLRAAVCATGKGDTLVWKEGGKTWVFNTPSGEFTVQYKSANPRWVPPEWDYVERGEEPPDWLGRARQARYDMLGDYAINFGNQYNIHGTLYEGLLGESITHGCVRVGALDLAYIYSRVHKGTKIFIY